jgi:O-antigen/teichoic acid export membrane protein
MLNTVVTSGLGLIYWWLAARIYSTYDYGWNSAIIPTMTLISSLAQLNMSSALTRFLPVAGRSAGRFLSVAYGLSVVATGFLAFGFLGIDAASPTGKVAQSQPSAFLLWFVVASMLWSVFALQDYALAGLRASVWVFLENAAFGLLKIILLIVLFPITAPYGIFLSWTLPIILTIVPVNWLIARRLLPARPTASAPAPLTVRAVSGFIVMDYIGAIFWLLSTMLLPILVLNLAGAEAAGYFYTAWVIGYALDLVAASMSTSLTVEGAHDQSQFAAVSRKALIRMAQLLIPVVALVVIFAPLILSFWGERFAVHSSDLLRWLALGALPRIVIVIYHSRQRVWNKTGQLALVQALTCTLVIGLSVALIPTQGIAGVGIAWFVAQSLTALIAGVLLWGRVGLSPRAAALAEQAAP